MVKTGVKASEKHTNRLLPIMFGRNTLQQNRFLALIGNEELLLENLDVALNSTDVGTIQALKSLDSLESKINQMQVAFQQFYTTIGIEEVWKKFVDGATNAINTLNSLPKAFGKVPTGAIAMVANVIGLIKTGLRSGANEIAKVLTDVIHQAGSQGEAAAQQEGQKIGRSFLSFTNESLGEAWSLPNLKTSVSGVATVVGQSLTTIALMMDKTSESGRTLSGVLSGLGGAAQIFGGIDKGWAGIPDILLGVMNLINGIDLGIENSEERLERLTKEAQQLNDEAKVAKAEYNSLQRTADKLDELKEKRYDSAEAADAYRTAVEDLADKFPGLITGFDELGVVTIDEIGLTHELTSAREAAAEAALAAAEADRKKAEQDLENVSKAQDRKIESAALSGLDIAEPIKKFVYEVFSKSGGIYESLDEAYKSLFDKNGNFGYKEYTDSLLYEYNLDENTFNQIKELIDGNLAKLVDGAQQRIQNLFKTDNGEYINLTKEKITEIQNYIIENGLEEFYKPFLEFAEEYKRGIIEINKSSNVLTGYEKKELGLLVEDYKETEKEFFEKLGNNSEFLDSYLSMRAQAYKEAGNTFDKYKTDKLAFDFDEFKKAFEGIDVSAFNKMWENRIKYTVEDFKKAFGDNNTLMQVIEDYYGKTIPDYVSKLNTQIIPTLKDNGKFDTNILRSLRFKIGQSKDTINEDLYTWISSIFELAQDYIDRGFTTAGNNILSSIAEILGLLDSEGLDPNVRNQISEALRNANFGTIEGIDELIKTLDEMDIELPKGMIESFQKIRSQLNYNIPLGIQAWTNQLSEQTKSFSEAVAKMSKGMDIDEAIAIMNSINTTDGKKIGLSDFAIKSGKFYLKDADLRKRYIESITKEQDKALEKLQIRIGSVLNSEDLNFISENFNKIIGGASLNVFSKDKYREVYNTLNNLGLVVDTAVEGFFKIDTVALASFQLEGETLKETVERLLTEAAKEGQEISDELRKQVIAQFALEANDLKTFLETLYSDRRDRKNIEGLLKEGKISEALALHPLLVQYKDKLIELYSNTAKNVFDKAIESIGQEQTFYFTNEDGIFDQDTLNQLVEAGIFTEHITDEFIGYTSNLTSEYLSAFIEIIRDSKLSLQDKGALISQATEAVLAQGDDEITNTLLDNLSNLSREVYEQFYQKAAAVDKESEWTKLWTSFDGGNTFDFTGSLTDLIALLIEITNGLTEKTVERLADVNKERLEKIGDELDKQIGKEVSKETADFLNQLEDFHVVYDHGKYIIESLGDIEAARQAYYDELVVEFGEDAEIVKQEKAKLIEAHNSTEQKALDAINKVMDATGGEWIDITDFTSQLSEEQSAKLESSLKKFGAQIEDGILKIPEGANIAGIQRTVFDTAKNASEDLKISLGELADSYAKAISRYADLISNAISGGISNVDAGILQNFASSNGLDTLDFRRTTEGLQLAQNSAIQLYQTIKQIDDIQGQIVFKELSDSLVKNNAEYQNMTTLLAHIEELNREISNLPVDSKRRQEYERELEVAKEIKETRAMTDPEYFDFMSGDMPDPLKGAETYWNSVNKAFTVMNQAAETGYMSLTDFYNLVNHMNDVAQQTGKTTEFMGYQLDGSLTSASDLIQKGFNAIKNVDGQGAMINLRSLGDSFEEGAAGMQQGMQRGAKAMAKANIEMLDGLIAQLELIVAMEEFDKIDYDKDNEIDLTELFPKYKLGDYTLDENGKQAIDNVLKAADTNKDLAHALDTFKIGDKTMREEMERARKGLIKDEGEAKIFHATLAALYKALKTGDFSPENIRAETIRILQESLGEGEWVDYTLADGTQVKITHEGYVTKDEKGWKINGEGQSYNTFEEAKAALEFESETGYKAQGVYNNEVVFSNINISENVDLYVTKNLKTGKVEYKVSSSAGIKTFDNKDDAINYAYESEQQVRESKGLDRQDFDEWYIKNNVKANFDLTINEVAVKANKTVGQLSDEVLEEYGIDTKLVYAIEAGVQRVLADFDLGQVIMDNLVPNFNVDENGAVSYSNNPQVEKLGEMIGNGMGPSITTAVVSALQAYFGTDEPKESVGGAIEDGIDDAAESAEVTDKNYTIDEAHATLNSMIIDHVNNPHFSSNILSDLLEAVGLKEKQSDLTLEKATATVENLEINKVGHTSLATGNLLTQALDKIGVSSSDVTIDKATATVKELEINKVGTPKFSEGALSEEGESSDLTIDKASATITNLSLDNSDNITFSENAKLNVDSAEVSVTNLTLTDEEKTTLSESVEAEINAVVGDIDVSSIETAQQAVATAVTNASDSLSTLGTNIDTAKGKVDTLATSLNTIEKKGPEEAAKFKTALNAIEEDKGAKEAENFKTAINAIEGNGPARAFAFKEAVNDVSLDAPGYARKFVNAVNDIKDKTFKITGSVNVTVSVNGAASAHASLNTSIAKGNVALAGGRKQTLMGELGPELYVTNGHYYIAGQNGAEMVDLPDDAIVFNHLQTERLLKNGSGGRGKPVKSEAAAVAHAAGNVAFAPGNARQILELLKQMRAAFQAMLDSSLSNLGALSGKYKNREKATNSNNNNKPTSSKSTSSKPTSSTSSSGKKSSSPTKSSTKLNDNVDNIAKDIHNAQPGHVVNTIEKMYNSLRRIEKLNKDIDYQKTLINLYQNDRYMNGDQIAETMVDTMKKTQELIEKNQERYTEQDALFQADYEYFKSSPYGQFYTLTDNGMELAPGAQERLDALYTEKSTGEGVGNAKDYRSQVDYLMSLGIGVQDMWFKDGQPLVAHAVSLDEMYDENYKKLDESQLSDVYRQMVEIALNNIDKAKNDLQESFNSQLELRETIADNVASLNEQVNEVINMEMELENKVLKAVEDKRQAEINEIKGFADALDKSTQEYIQGLNKALEQEKNLLNSQKDTGDLNKLQRQLAILQRSGGSASQIQGLQEQIQSKQQDIYLDTRQKEISSIEEAANTQIEQLNKQIEIMTETLEYDKQHGLLWNDVKEIMKQGPDKIVSFITDFDSDWLTKSDFQSEEDLLGLKDLASTVTSIKTAIGEDANGDKEASGLFKLFQIKEGPNEEPNTRNADSNDIPYRDPYTQTNDDIFEDADEVRSHVEDNNNNNNNNDNNNNNNNNFNNNYNSGSGDVYTPYTSQIETYRDQVNTLGQQKIDLEGQKASALADLNAARKEYEAYNETRRSAIARQYGSKSTEYQNFFTEKKQVEAKRSSAQTSFNQISSDLRKVKSNLSKSESELNKLLKQEKDYLIQKEEDEKKEKEEERQRQEEEARRQRGEIEQEVVYVEEPKKKKKRKKTQTISSSAATYASGGLIDYTGPAWVDGTKSDPESILDSKSTTVLQELLSLQSELKLTTSLQQDFMDSFHNQMNNFSLNNNYAKIIDTIVDKLDSFANFTTPPTNESSVNIEKFELTMNAKISDNYSAERAGEVVYNKILQIAKKSGNYGSITRR